MFQEITYYLIFGKPLIVWLGIVTLLTILFTVSIPLMNRRGIRTIPMAWHSRCAALAVTLAILHGTLGFLAY